MMKGASYSIVHLLIENYESYKEEIIEGPI